MLVKKREVIEITDEVILIHRSISESIKNNCISGEYDDMVWCLEDVATRLESTKNPESIAMYAFQFDGFLTSICAIMESFSSLVLLLPAEYLPCDYNSKQKELLNKIKIDLQQISREIKNYINN